MPVNIRPSNRNQLLILPPSVDDWVPADHLARAVLAAVGTFDLSKFRARLRPDGKGGASYDPELLVAVVLYAFCVGLYSSRKIERACTENVAFRMLCANTTPDHTTISRFLKNCADELEALFDQVLQLCVKANLIDGTVVALDGTKIEANASKEKFFDTGSIARLALRQILDNDQDEDACFGVEHRGDEVPEQLFNPEWIKKATEEIEAQRQVAKQARPNREPAPSRVNTTDPDCRMMKTRHGFKPAYNAQAVATKDQFIVGADVTQQKADSHQLASMSELVVNNLKAHEITPQNLLCDAGYWDSGQVATSLIDNTLVSLRDDLANGTTLDIETIRQIFVDVIDGQITQGQAAELLGITRAQFRGQLKLYRQDPDAGLAIYTMRQRHRDPENQRLVALRKSIIEPIFGQMKFNRSFTRFRRRSIEAAKAEWSLHCAVHNLMKWATATTPTSFVQ